MTQHPIEIAPLGKAYFVEINGKRVKFENYATALDFMVRERKNNEEIEELKKQLNK